MATDPEIMARSVTHPEAFEEIFGRHGDAVLGYARRRLGAMIGEDVAAQTFLTAFERRGRFDPRYASARPWLLGICNNLIRHHLRDERVHLSAIARTAVEVGPGAVDDPSLVERLDAERLGPEIAEALLKLSEADRETFLLVALTDLSYEETAGALGIPIGTVRSRIHRSRMILRERMDELGAIPPRTQEGSYD